MAGYESPRRFRLRRPTAVFTLPLPRFYIPEGVLQAKRGLPLSLLPSTGQRFNEEPPAGLSPPGAAPLPILLLSLLSLQPCLAVPMVLQQHASRAHMGRIPNASGGGMVVSLLISCIRASQLLSTLPR